MTRVAIDPAERRAIQADFPKRDIEAMYVRFVRWAEKREIYAPERAFRTWAENAERDDTNRLDAGGRPATEMASAPPGERSDPSYAAFRMGLIQRILAEKLSPVAVASILAEYHSKFAELPGVSELLDKEIAALRARGASRGVGGLWLG